MKNVVGKPLDDLRPLIGAWSLEGRHVALPDTVVRGHALFEWWGDRTFLIQRQTIDHPDFPDSIAVMGATRPDGGLAQHYFDSRGVYRLFDMTYERGVWTLERKAAGPGDFDQRMRSALSADGNSILFEADRTEPGAHEFEHDLSMTFTRLTPH